MMYGAICTGGSSLALPIVNLSGNLFYGNVSDTLNANTISNMPEDNGSMATINNNGYNIWDNSSYNFTFSGTDAHITQNLLDQATLAPLSSSASQIRIVPAGLQNFPAIDFAGRTRLNPGAAGAIEYSGVGINDLTANRLSFYPNPATDELRIENCELQTGENVQIFDAAGKLIFNGQLSTANTIDVSQLAAGTYMLKVENYVGKFVKR